MRTKLLITFVLAMSWISVCFGATAESKQMTVQDAKSVLMAIKESKAKLKVVNMWASWCAPCQKELPDFAKVEKKFKDVEFFYVSGDDENEAAAALKTIEKTGVAGRLYRLSPINEEAFRSFSPLWSGTLPTTFFYYGKNLTDQTSKPLDEKRLTDWVKFRLAHPTRKYLQDEPTKPKVENSQGKNMSTFTEFESKKVNPDFATVHDVVAEEVDKKRSGVRLIDVRQPDEFTGELSHIPGATLVPLGALPEKINELPKDQTIIFICRSGARSAKAAALAQQNGFTSVYNLKGGMIRWNELRLPVAKTTTSAETESKK